MPEHDWRRLLQEEMDRQGLNAKQVSLSAGQGETFVRDILAGAEPRAKALASIARVLGMTLHKLYTGQDPDTLKVSIIGTVGEDALWAPLSSKRDPSQLREIEFKIEGGEAVALQVKGNSLRVAGYRDGDLLIGAKRVGTHADNLIGLECIIMTTDGQRYVRFLERGNARGTFNLRPHHPDDPVLINAKVDWAAPIMWIKRALH